MTTSFRAKFPTNSLTGLRVFGREPLNPAEWAKREAQQLKQADIVVCFNPVSIEAGAPPELEVAALLLVFKQEENSAPLGILLTDDFYVTGSSESVLRERAAAAQAKNSYFAYLTVPHKGEMSAEARNYMASMQRWGSGGTRSTPMNGLPDPPVAFLACAGAQIPASPPTSIGVLSQALVQGINIGDMPDLSHIYGINSTSKTGPVQQSIESVTLIEPTQTEEAALAELEEKEASSTESAEVTASEVTDLEEPTQPSTDDEEDLNTTPQPEPPANLAIAPPAASASGAAAEDFLTRSQNPKQNNYRQGDTSTNESRADSGFLSIRQRLEARLSGRLPRAGAAPLADLGPAARSETTSPVVRLVSNIRQQMSIASDNLEYRVSTLKSKMLDRLVSCKHNLSEKEQQSLKALEDLRAQMQVKLESTASQAKDELSACASQGTAQVRAFQTKASVKVSELLAVQEAIISQSAESAKKQVNDSLSGSKEELNKTVSRTQHSLRGLVTTTEVNLNQVVNQCGESMDERIAGFRVQTQILAEGIGLSVESLGEAAKLQAQQAEDEVIKRLEGLSEESLKSLREQSVRAEMECTKLIDKLSRDKLVPSLQEKRKMVVELAAFFHDEFSNVMQDLLDSKLAEFEPIVRLNSDSNSAALQDFTGRWTGNLEQHQKDLDELEARLREKVDEYLGAAKSGLESMHDITKVTDHVLTSPELLRTREETCLKFDIVAREHVAKAYELSGNRVQSFKQESLEALRDLRQAKSEALRNRGEESRTRIKSAIKNAMQKIQDLQSKHTA